MIDELRRPRTTAPALQRMITDRWRCPVCFGKSGSDAVVLHHDHIECYVSWLMADTSRLPGPAIELKPVHDFNLLSEFITTVRGFPPTLICHSCNELDGANLKQRGAHIYFSLSATDLSAIYCGENEGGRARSFDLAFALWGRRAAVYGARLVEIAWLLRDHLAQARWQREPVSTNSRRPPSGTGRLLPATAVTRRHVPAPLQPEPERPATLQDWLHSTTVQSLPRFVQAAPHQKILRFRLVCAASMPTLLPSPR